MKSQRRSRDEDAASSRSRRHPETLLKPWLLFSSHGRGVFAFPASLTVRTHTVCWGPPLSPIPNRPARNYDRWGPRSRSFRFDRSSIAAKSAQTLRSRFQLPRPRGRSWSDSPPFGSAAAARCWSSTSLAAIRTTSSLNFGEPLRPVLVLRVLADSCWCPPPATSPGSRSCLKQSVLTLPRRATLRWSAGNRPRPGGEICGTLETLADGME